MRNWLIKKLGGYPSPEKGIALLVYEDQEGPIVAHVEGGRFEMIDYLGGVPLPKAGEGQYLRRPAACRMPVRKAKTETVAKDVAILESSGAEVHETTTKTIINLCDNCQASAQSCHKAIKAVDFLNNTYQCDQYAGGN